MRNLLCANLRRLVRSKAFLAALLAQLAYTALAVLSCWDHCAAGDKYTMEYILTAGYVLLSYLPIPALILAPLLSLYLGADYSSRTLRNKLIVGHTRTEVYLADLLACVLTAAGFDALYLILASIFCAGAVRDASGTLFRFPLGQALAWTGAALLARMAWAAALKLAATVSGNRTACAIIGLLLVVLAALLCTSGVEEIGYLSRNLGVPGNAERLRNWQLALDFLPTGQYYQISRLDTPNLWRMPLLSLGGIAVSTGAGLAFFRRKDLK